MLHLFLRYMVSNDRNENTGCPKKTHFQNAVDAPVATGVSAPKALQVLFFLAPRPLWLLGHQQHSESAFLGHPVD